MSSVFVVSQSSCFYLCSREQIRLVENRLKGEKGVASQLLRTVMVIGSIQQLLLCSQQGNRFVFFHKITVQLENRGVPNCCVSSLKTFPTSAGKCVLTKLLRSISSVRCRRLLNVGVRCVAFSPLITRCKRNGHM